jgi:hypothetical protein
MHTAFSGMLGTLNQTGVLGPFGDALNGIDQAISRVEGHAKNLGPALMGAGGALAGVGVGLSALGSTDQAAHAQLQASVEATGKSYEDYAKQVDSAIKHQEKFGDTANQTEDALRILTQATGDPTKALQYLGTATDLAAAKHEDLTSAATTLGKAYNGNTKVLKEFGIQVTKASTAQKQAVTASKQAESADANLAHAKRTLADIEAVDAAHKKLTVGQAIQLRNAQEGVTTASEKSVLAHKNLIAAQTAAKNAAAQQGITMTDLAAKLHGQASAAADTFSGRLKEVRAKLEDAAASFGQKYGPALTGAGAAMTGLGAAMTAGKGALEATKAAALGTRLELMALSAWEKITAAATWLLNVALDANPIVLVVLAVAALIAIIVLVLLKTGLLKDAWNDMKAVALDVWHGILFAVQVVWDWIKTNWPLLLGILLGPIALAAALIWKYWDQIEAGAKAAVDWIVAVWNGLVSFFVGLPGRIASVAAGMWHGITDAFSAAISAVYGVWNGVMGWLTGLGARIDGAVAGMWDGILSAFRSVINAVIDLWNELHFTLPKVSFLGAHIGGESIGVPHIPHLAQGGLITSTGLVYAHAGEAISPIPAKLTGPAVVVQHAHFATEVDVEAFMRRAAWVIKTQRV